MFDSVLIPLDGSTLAEQALGPAASLVDVESGSLIFLRVPVFKELAVVGVPGYGWMPPTPEIMKGPQREAESYLLSLAGDRAFARSDVRTVVVDGDIAGAVVDTARARHADLIVMTTHGRSGLTRWVLGSVTARVLQQAPCPVLALRPNLPISRVLIPLDGSALAESALDPAIKVAAAFGARVTLLHVQTEQAQTVADIMRDASGQDVRQLTPQLNAAEHPQSYLTDVVRRHRHAPVALAQVVVEGVPGPRILDYATKHDIDCIAMATHGYSGLKRWIFGSTTQKVIDHSPCNMLIVRPPAVTVS
jgi:nucleotide-binding universal stress UspA family protein